MQKLTAKQARCVKGLAVAYEAFSNACDRMFKTTEDHDKAANSVRAWAGILRDRQTETGVQIVEDDTIGTMLLAAQRRINHNAQKEAA